MGTGQSKTKGILEKFRKAQNNDNVSDTKSVSILPGHELVEIENHNQQPLNLADKIDPITISCDNKDDFLQFFETINTSKELLLEFQFTDVLPELDAKELQKMIRENLSVLVMVFEFEEKWTIYWKIQETELLVELKQPKKLNWKENLNLLKFVANFLAKSANYHHSGLVSQFSLQSGSRSIDLDLLADCRDFNLLLLAAECGNAEIVEILLKLKINVNSMDNKVNAQALARDGRHFDVLYVLLQHDLIFPESFDSNECRGKLKEFCDVTEEVHKLISSNDKDKLEEILQQHPNLRHFYNFSNKSALMSALEAKSFDVFDFLLSKKLRFGSYENPAEYYEELDDVLIKRQIRDIQNKYSQPFLEKHIHTLVANSTACFDETEVKDKHDTVKRAFELLSQNLFIRIILKIVAASKNFIIVFDFNREAVNILDPTTSGSTLGICYLSGKIFIGAKQLLDPGTEHETLAVLIHELCHFAMNLVYKNKANPYKKENQKTMAEFEEISIACEEACEDEEVISSVFECYPEEAFHAELIVRVVHLLALYRNLPEKLAEVRTTFIKLFEFYEQKIVPELQQALPDIERHDEKILEIKDQKIFKFKKISIIGGILGVLGVVVGIIVALCLYTPTYKFDELSVEDRMATVKAPIWYKGTNLKIRDLFGENSTVYSQLTSDHISRMLSNKSLDLADPHLHYLEKQVVHVWANLTDKLKTKILNSNFTFQNETLKLHQIDSKLLNYLTSEQIIEVLDGHELAVHKMIKNETKFYTSRKIMNENFFEIFFEYVEYVGGNVDKTCPSIDMSTANKSFETFYHESIGQTMSNQLKKFNETRKTDEFKKCANYYYKKYYRPSSQTQNLVHPIDFDQVLNLANATKFFVLSGEAGTGKTVTFEQFTMRIKKKFPTHWVSYIDLKEHKKLYKSTLTLQDVKDTLETIFGVSFKNEFERKTFEDSFESGNLILLWNGFDEISPQFSYSMIRILRIIRYETKNIQLVCTRSIYSDVLRHNFTAQIYNLIPFDLDEQENFVQKFLISANIEESKIPNYVQKVQKIVKSTGSTEAFDTPLMLGMISELIASDVKIYESENLYEIYQKFVNRKIQIWREKVEFAKKFVDNSFSNYGGFNILKLYQSFAIKMESQINTNLPIFTTKLKIMRQENPSDLTSDEISRMGILYINGFRNIKFAHRTFAEFFIAQYLIENIYIANDEPTIEEAELRIISLAVFAEKKEISRFITYYIQTKPPAESKLFDKKISKLLTTKYQSALMFDIANYESLSYPVYFFRKDPTVLKKMLQIDANETYYTTNFRYPKKNYEAVEYNQLKTLVAPYLNSDEFDRFIRGKNQKGVILFSEYCYEKSKDLLKGQNIVHDFYKLDNSLKLNDDPAAVFKQIANNLTKEEFKELVKSGIIFEELKNHKSADLIATFVEFLDQRYNESEQKELLLPVFTNIIRFEKFSFSRFLPLLIKIGSIFNENDIYYIYETYLFPVMYYRPGDFFHILWNIFDKKTSREMQKKLLRKTSFCVIKLACFPIGFLFNPFLEDFGRHLFDGVVKIYESYFNVTEIQDYVLSHTSDMLLILIVCKTDTRVYAEYMSSLFKGNEKALKEFFLRDVEPTNLNVFQLFTDFEDTMGNLKVYTDLYESLLKY